MRAGGVEEELQQLRSRATELLLREQWQDYIALYTHFISLCRRHLVHSPQDSSKLQKALCLALANRADALSRTRDFSGAIDDCNQALDIDPVHSKALFSKGKILLDLDRYSMAADCFRQVTGSPAAAGLLDRCRRLEAQARTGVIDLSGWVLNGFDGDCPEMAEYVGGVEIRRLENGGRGLFATKNVESGTPLVITKAVVIGRGILPEPTGDGSSENARMAMWKDFVDRILDTTEKCSRTLSMIYMLSTGEKEGELGVPDMGLFRPEAEEERFPLKNKEPDVGRILKVLDVNCLAEEAVSAKVLGRNSSGVCGIGLWILPSFVNHSCNPNARRLHVGDRVVIHASRDVKAGQEITFPYFDVLLPLHTRKEMSKRWGFRCNCGRCQFEENEAAWMEPEVREMEKILDSEGDFGELVVRVEEGMKRLATRTKERGYLRASLWTAYARVFESERMMRKWGRRIPAELVVAENVMSAVGGDERVLKVAVGRLRKRGSGGGVGEVEVEERVMRLGKGTYGKVMKKQGMRALFESLTW